MFKKAGFVKYTEPVLFDSYEEVLNYAREIVKELNRLVENYDEIFEWSN